MEIASSLPPSAQVWPKTICCVGSERMKLSRVNAEFPRLGGRSRSGPASTIRSSSGCLKPWLDATFSKKIYSSRGLGHWKSFSCRRGSKGDIFTA